MRLPPGGHGFGIQQYRVRAADRPHGSLSKERIMETQPNQGDDQQGGASAEQEAGEQQRSDEAPRKQHGDALMEGNGTRHGVQDAQTRPET
jgi:hypothetical protein